MDYIKLDRNDHGIPFMYYNPDEKGRYKCWMILDEELFLELQKRLKSKDEIKRIK
tara:strand:- start:694 stop:858 length:165 start_codon:yes stop_codon:yes gene_type:complete